jgi:hypothetical protein
MGLVGEGKVTPVSESKAVLYRETISSAGPWATRCPDSSHRTSSQRLPTSPESWETSKHMVTALLSRLRHQCTTIRIDGPSLREPQG